MPDPSAAPASSASWSASPAPARPVRVILVDDDPLTRAAIKPLLRPSQDYVVVAEAGDGREAIDVVGRIEADIVLMDLGMPVMDGITATETIRRRFPATRVLMVTTFGRPGYLQRALDAGATGFMVKDAPVDQLADAVRRVAKGLRVVDPTLAVETLSRGTSPLTERESDVLRAVSTGGTIADIAREMRLSQGTVRNHVSSAMLKTEARTRAEAVRIATESGWL